MCWYILNRHFIVKKERRKKRFYVVLWNIRSAVDRSLKLNTVYFFLFLRSFRGGVSKILHNIALKHHLVEFVGRPNGRYTDAQVIEIKNHTGNTSRSFNAHNQNQLHSILFSIFYLLLFFFLVAACRHSKFTKYISMADRLSSCLVWLNTTL